ncbi:hypothetical protein, partial [Bacillus sp. SRB3LM]|uniref:hypothetical protein n=1 Tax=Bacillus sp. SRB3LM TaxID=2608689 RepID=UPI001E636865
IHENVSERKRKRQNLGVPSLNLDFVSFLWRYIITGHMILVQVNDKSSKLFEINVKFSIQVVKKACLIFYLKRKELLNSVNTAE